MSEEWGLSKPPEKITRSAPVQNVAPVQPQPVRDDPIEQLKKLGELRAAGIITDEEFEQKKKELMGQI